MSSNDDSETRRALPRDFRSANASSRENPPASAPSLPSLRSLSTRRPSAAPASDSADASARARPFDLLPDRYYELVIPWTDDSEDAIRHDDDWEDHTLSQGPWPWNFDDTDPVPGSQPHSSRLGEDEYDRRATNNLWQPDPDEENSPSRTQRYLNAYHLRRALWDPTLPQFYSSRTSQQQHDPPEDNRRVKRRKLDSDRLSSNFRGFQYGKYGQVQPGQLTMELVSCDGGMYSSEDTTTKYAAENILKNDHSVYCTEGPRCNIILRHQGATVFTLKELVIKAPRSNFTDPYVHLGKPLALSY